MPLFKSANNELDFHSSHSAIQAAAPTAALTADSRIWRKKAHQKTLIIVASMHHFPIDSTVRWNWRPNKKYHIVMLMLIVCAYAEKSISDPTPGIRFDELSPISIWMCFVACLTNVKLKIGLPALNWRHSAAVYICFISTYSIINIHLHNVWTISIKS